MKIRNGFVSNSSSSSFIIQKDSQYKTSYDLAKFMIIKRGCERNDELLESLNNLSEEFKINTPDISFFSCNYDTFILDEGEYYLIATCNNEDWGIDSNVNSMNLIVLNDDYEQYLFKDNIDAVYMYDEYDIEGVCDVLKNERDFYLIDEGLIGTPSKEYMYCASCYSDFWIIDHTSQCPTCRKDVNGSLEHLKPAMRKKILDKLNI